MNASPRLAVSPLLPAAPSGQAPSHRRSWGRSIRGGIASLLARALAGLALTAAANHALAQAPAKPLRIVVPTPPGGGSDTAARTIAESLARTLAQPVVVENRPGAGGAIAARAVLGAPADGHTLLWAVASMAGLPALMKEPPYRSLADLAAVSITGRLTFALMVNAQVPATTLDAFVRHARAHPDKLAFATGTLGELMAAERFLRAADLRAVRVPYKGGAQLLPDLVADRVQFNFGPIGPGVPHARQGRLRILAVLDPARSVLAPEAPTMTEAGLGAVTVPSWQALFAPPGTPRTVVDHVATAVAAAVRDPEVRRRVAEQGLVVEASTPDALAAMAVADTTLWRAFVRENDIPQE